MNRKALLVDPSEYDLDHVIADLDEIRKYNRQRFEMEQLTAVVYENEEQLVSVGYQDLTENEFWVRGHLPGTPLMPGVLICETAAQLASYFVAKYKLMGEGVVMGFGGLQDVRFRGMVPPGKRLVMQVKQLKARHRMVTAQFLGLVDDNLVCDGILKGIPLPVDMLKAEA